MRFKQPAITVLTLMLVVAAVPCVSAAQEEADSTLYVQVDCMKSTSADYVDVETEIWQPMHQQAVKQGKQAGWALYWVLYGDRSVCDYYTVNTYRGLDQLNAAGDASEYFAAAHPGENWDEAMQRTAASRDHVRSQLWIWIDGIPGGDYRFIVVNQMYAEDGPAYVQFEQETWKPIHQALVEGGHGAGWGLYALSSPQGTSIPYNYATVDFLERLGPAPIEETIEAVHPDADVAGILQQGLDLRDPVLGETWVLIASTE